MYLMLCFWKGLKSIDVKSISPDAFICVFLGPCGEGTNEDGMGGVL
jgi:hypothetical protein